MQKIILSTILTCFSYLSLFAQETKLIYKNVSAKLPAELKWQEKMNPGDPFLMKNDAGNATLAYTINEEEISDNDIPAYADDQLKLARHDDESFAYLDDGIYLQDGKNIGYLKFSTKEAGKKYFNYTFFISVDNKPLIFKFICLLKDRKKWEGPADVMANSIRIKQ